MPDLDDIDHGGMLDLAHTVARELFEETGLDIGARKVEAGWIRRLSDG